jgi:hypothetical protein
MEETTKPTVVDDPFTMNENATEPESTTEEPELSAQERSDELTRLRKELADRDARDAEREMQEIGRMRAEVAQRDLDRAEADPEVYVHLANGDVERTRESNLPGAAGTNAANGYWEKDGKVHYIVGVFPAEADSQEK